MTKDKAPSMGPPVIGRHRPKRKMYTRRQLHRLRLACEAEARTQKAGPRRDRLDERVLTMMEGIDGA